MLRREIRSLASLRAAEIIVELEFGRVAQVEHDKSSDS